MSDPNFASVDPADALGTLRLTQGLVRQGDYATAEKLVGWSLDYNPDNAPLYRRMSDIVLARGAIAEALAWAELLIEIESDDADNHAHLATLYQRADRSERVEPTLRRALELDPSRTQLLRRLSDILLRRGDAAEAHALAERAVAARPQELPNHIHLAGLLTSLGKLEAAEAALLAALILHPGSGTLLRKMSDVTHKCGDRAAAVRWAERAVEEAPGDAQLLNHLASMHEAAGDLASALLAIESAAIAAPADRRILRHLSDIARKQGDMPKALEAAQAALAIDASDSQSHYQLSTIHFVRNELDGAEAAALRALALAPNHPAFLRRLSEIALRRGDAAAAMSLIERSLAAAPKEANSHNHRATILFTQGDRRGAEEALRQAVEAAPKHAGFQKRLQDSLKKP